MAAIKQSSDRIGLNIFREEDGSPDLFALYSGDLSERVMSFASGTDLCKLDVLNKHFKGLTAAAWKNVTYEKFGLKGMENGKDGWRLGVSYLREPEFVSLRFKPGHGGMYYQNLLFPQVTAYNSLIAVTTGSFDRERHAPRGINLYNAKDLTHIETRRVGDDWQALGLKTTVAGPTGNEIFVTSNRSCLELSFREHDLEETQIFRNTRGSGVLVIGCETHLIVVAGNIVHLYKLSTSNQEEEETLLVLCQSEFLGRDGQNDDERFHNSISWDRDQSEFAIFHSVAQECEITVWKLDSGEDRISRTHALSVNVELVEIALADYYFIGTTFDKKIHVWDRKTGDKMPEIMPDVEIGNEDLLRMVHPLSMSCHGHILVTPSRIGCAICIWNIKTGRLLKKYSETHNSNVPYDTTDACSMAYLKNLNGFICVNGYLNAWLFPTNQTQKDLAVAAREKQEDLRREYFDQEIQVDEMRQIIHDAEDEMDV